MSYSVSDPNYEELLLPGVKHVGNVVIDWGKAITDKLVLCVLNDGRLTANDLVTGAYPIAISTANTSVSTSINGQGINYANDNAYQDFATPASFGNEYTVVCFCEPSNATTYLSILDDDQGTSRGFQLRVNNTGGIQFIPFWTGGNGAISSTNLSLADLKKGVFCAAKADASNYYVMANDELKSLSNGNTIVAPFYQDKIRVAARKTLVQKFQGNIITWMVWDRALSDSELYSLYRNLYQFMIPA